MRKSLFCSLLLLCRPRTLRRKAFLSTYVFNSACKHLPETQALAAPVVGGLHLQTGSLGGRCTSRSCRSSPCVSRQIVQAIPVRGRLCANPACPLHGNLPTDEPPTVTAADACACWRLMIMMQHRLRTTRSRDETAAARVNTSLC